MANNFVKAIADKHNIPMEELEALWDESKDKANDDDLQTYSYVTSMFIDKVKEKYNLDVSADGDDAVAAESEEEIPVEESVSLDTLLRCIVLGESSLNEGEISQISNFEKSLENGNLIRLSEEELTKFNEVTNKLSLLSSKIINK